MLEENNMLKIVRAQADVIHRPGQPNPNSRSASLSHEATSKNKADHRDGNQSGDPPLHNHPHTLKDQVISQPKHRRCFQRLR
jgi:hypothetical protein